MNTPSAPLARLAAQFSSAALRDEFLVSGLFRPGELHLRTWDIDRTVIGGISPMDSALALLNPPDLRASFFLERREAGVVNLGGLGAVVVDGQKFVLAPLDALYLGRDARDVSFVSVDLAKPARFYLLSYPAHASYATRHVAFADVPGTRLGDRTHANERSLHKLIHPGAFPTCQLVMGVTRLDVGSVWNTMPPHTHLRRSEVYLYFDLPADQAVFHFMGAPQDTRHLVVRDTDVVLSPPWSIHCGAGTCNYSFVWGMGGENQEFADMDAAPIKELQ